MAIDLSENGPLFFSINGFNFEKWNDPNNDYSILYLQEHRIGLVSGGKIYFDIHKLDLLGDMTLWPDTLNYATSDDNNINNNYEDQRDHLQHILHEMRMATAHAIIDAIHHIAFDNVEIDSDEETDEDLTDYEDFDEDFEEDYFMGGEIPTY